MGWLDRAARDIAKVLTAPTRVSVRTATSGAADLIGDTVGGLRNVVSSGVAPVTQSPIAQAGGLLPYISGGIDFGKGAGAKSNKGLIIVLAVIGAVIALGALVFGGAFKKSGTGRRVTKIKTRARRSTVRVSNKPYSQMSRKEKNLYNLRKANRARKAKAAAKKRK